MDWRLSVETGSRIHFGLLAFGESLHHRYGGIGLMIQCPGVQLLARSDKSFGCVGPLSQRVATFASRWAGYHGVSLPACRVSIERCAALHVGLGTGTQLGLSVAALLDEWQQVNGAQRKPQHTRRPRPAIQLATSVGRGQRSSVGTYGFDLGGLIFEHGKRPGQSLGRLAQRVPLHEAWRLVVWTPAGQRGLSGDQEQQAFEKTPAVSPATTERLLAIATDEIMPQAKAANIDAFGDAVYRYGYEAGQCFAKAQGGAFASGQLESWVRAVRRRGVQGVGQSSWGPSLFAVVANNNVAQETAEWFARDVARNTPVATTISPVDNHGARLRWHR